MADTQWKKVDKALHTRRPEENFPTDEYAKDKPIEYLIDSWQKRLMRQHREKCDLMVEYVNGVTS